MTDQEAIPEPRCEKCDGTEEEHGWLDDPREAALYGGAHTFVPAPTSAENAQVAAPVVAPALLDEAREIEVWPDGGPARRADSLARALDTAMAYQQGRADGVARLAELEAALDRHHGMLPADEDCSLCHRASVLKEESDDHK